MDKDILAEDTIHKLIDVNNAINNAASAIQSEFNNNYENLDAEQLEIMNKVLQDFLKAHNETLISLKSAQKGLEIEQEFIQDVVQSTEPLNTIKSKADLFVEEATKYYSKASEKLNDGINTVIKHPSFFNRIASKFAINLTSENVSQNSFDEEEGLQTRASVNKTFSERLIEKSYKTQIGLSSLASRAASLPKFLEQSLASNIDNKVGAISEGLKRWKQSSLENYEKLKFNSKFLLDDLRQSFVNVNEKMEEMAMNVESKGVAFERTFDQLVRPIISKKFEIAKNYFYDVFEKLKIGFNKFEEKTNSFVNSFDEQMKINSELSLKEIIEEKRGKIIKIEKIDTSETLNSSSGSDINEVKTLNSSSSQSFIDNTQVSTEQPEVKEKHVISINDFTNVTFKSRVDKQRSKLDESVAVTSKGPSGL